MPRLGDMQMVRGYKMPRELDGGVYADFDALALDEGLSGCIDDPPPGNDLVADNSGPAFVVSEPAAPAVSPWLWLAGGFLLSRFFK